MKTSRCFAALILLVIASTALCTRGAVTNTVPWADSFESYGNGTSLPATNGWVLQQAGAGVATTDVARAALLGNYLTGLRSLPLPEATHTNIVVLSSEVVNSVSSATGGVVVVDFMAMPSMPSISPPMAC